ncbi:hypothetical protein CUT44_30895 [Streptomyces carminius]|uniref:DUF397 domain-containing protein n=1 Tax=Streptomyces carminius TaxID=2665496 RepID=A0A2M8LPS4_9ACTN|nr:hypothetical protein CUT44_30895 [Streptomyces carminius]
MRYGLPTERRQKSSHSNAQSGNCVEIQVTDDGLIAVGDSKDRSPGAFVFPAGEWEAFVNTLRTEPNASQPEQPSTTGLAPSRTRRTARRLRGLEPADGRRREGTGRGGRSGHSSTICGQ